MEIGVSTACLYPLETEKALEKLLEMDFRSFEIFFNSQREFHPNFIRELKQQLDGRKAHVLSVHPYLSGYESFLLFSEYERRFWDTVEEYERCFEAANMLGARYVAIHGDKFFAISDSCYLERFRILAEKGMEYGVYVAQENVNGARSAKPEFIEKMKNYLGENAHFILDFKQAVRAGQDPYELCRAMGKCLAHLHLNDHGPQGDCLLPGDGVMDFLKLKQLLTEQEYHGVGVIEVYAGNFQEEEQILRAKKFLEKIFARRCP